MNKKQEEKLKGGLNALLGEGTRQEAPEREQLEAFNDAIAQRGHETTKTRKRNGTEDREE